MSDLATHALWLSVQLALLVVGIATPLAIALATVMARAQWRGKLVLNTLILLPLSLPPVCIGLSVWLGWELGGAMGGGLGDGLGGGLGDGLHEVLGWRPAFVPFGLALALLLTTLPLMARLLRTAFEATDPMLLAVARSLGASRWRAWWTVTLPMAAPAVVSAVALGLAAAWGEALALLWVTGWLRDPAHGFKPLNPDLNLGPTLGLGGGGVAQDLATSSAWGLAVAAWGVALLAVACSELARRRWRRMWRTRLALGPGHADPNLTPR